MNNATNIESKETTLKEIFLKISLWVKYLVGNWKTILIGCIVGVVCGISYSLLNNAEYEAELTFVLEDGKSSPFGMYTGVASQFGIDLGAASGGNGVFSEDNISVFLTSRLMIEKTLLSPVTIDGKNKSLADLYIDFSGLAKKWEKSLGIKNISFPPRVNRIPSTQQDSLLNIVHKAIIKKVLKVVKPDKKSSFILVKCSSKHEVFSKLFTERLVKEAANFYILTKTKRALYTVNLLQAKADSIESLLNKKTYSAAITQDINMNPVKRISTVNSELIARDKVVLQTIYGEVVKNLEMARMAMAQETPIFEIIDAPILPLEKNKLGLVKGAMGGALLTGFLVALFLIAKRLLKEIMADE